MSIKKILLFSFNCFIAQLGFAQTPLTQQTYDGLINNKFAITLTLTSDGNLLYGTLAYKKTGQPIKVVGSLQKDNVLLHEFDPKGSVTGTYFGNVKGDIISGLWTSAQGKEMNFSIRKTTQTNLPRPAFDVSGKYRYDFGKDNGMGSLEVKQVAKNKITISMEAVTGAPAYNQAHIDKTTLILTGNVATYRNNEFGKCELQVTFFDGGASIIYLNEAYNCGFGNAASVEGNYLKVGK